MRASLSPFVTIAAALVAGGFAVPASAKTDLCDRVHAYSEIAMLHGHMIRAETSVRARAHATRLLSRPVAGAPPVTGAFAGPLRAAISNASDVAATKPVPERSVSTQRDLLTLIRQSGCLNRQEMLELEGAGARNMLDIGEDAAPAPRNIVQGSNGDRTASRAILSTASLLILAGSAVLLGGIIFIFRWMMRKGDARNAPRFPVDLPARAEFPSADADWTCTVQDISIAGVKIAVPDQADVGARFRITIAGISRSATVSWSNQFYLGASFRSPLSQADLSAILTASQKAARSKKRRAPPKERPITEDARP